MNRIIQKNISDFSSNFPPKRNNSAKPYMLVNSLDQWAQSLEWDSFQRDNVWAATSARPACKMMNIFTEIKGPKELKQDIKIMAEEELRQYLEVTQEGILLLLLFCLHNSYQVSRQI